MDNLFRPKTTLEQWRILQAVVDHGSYGKAAERLNKSQSSLNHAVAKLQTQLGVNLLEVKGRQTVLTEAGKTMLRRSRQLLQDIEGLENLSQRIQQGWEQEITLAVEQLYDKSRLLKVLKEFWPQSRGSRIKIYDDVLSGTREKITNKSADIVISPMVPKGYISTTLCHAEMLPICHPEHNVLTQQPIKMDELANHLQLVIADTGEEKSDAGWLKSEQRWTVSNFYEALEILKNKMGFCWVPAHLAMPYLTSGELKKINVLGSHKREVSLHLILPDRDAAGPGTQLLERLILAEHGSSV
jgi:DNA-binding transcriptional LysR family regulator